MEDSKIIELYFTRSELAVSETAKKYGNYCHSIAYRILCNLEDAEECVNDTWLRAWNSMPPRHPQLLSAFLGKITRNLSLTRYEKQTAAKRGGGEIPVILDELSECIPSCVDVEQSVDTNILSALLNRFLGSLEQENRQLFVLRYWYLYPVKNAAKTAGMGESKAKMRLLRMRQQLKKLLEAEGY